jgi:hypothetical protein
MTSAHVKLTQLPQLETLWAYDQVLMDIALNQQHPPAELKAINRCRTYLQVTTLAKITTYDGTTILDEAFSAPIDNTNQLTLWNISQSTIILAKHPQLDELSWIT